MLTHLQSAATYDTPIGRLSWLWKDESNLGCTTRLTGTKSSTAEKHLSLLETQEWYEAPGDTGCYKKPSHACKWQVFTPSLTIPVLLSLLEMSLIKRQTELQKPQRRRANFSLITDLRTKYLFWPSSHANLIVSRSSYQCSSVQQVTSEWQSLALSTKMKIK